MHYAEGSAMTPLLLKLVAGRIASAPVPFFVRPVTRKIASKLENDFIHPQIETHYSFIEAELGKSEWLAGDELTAADVQMSFPLQAALARAGIADRCPKIRAFVDRVTARPAYQRAVERAGVLDILLAEDPVSLMPVRSPAVQCVRWPYFNPPISVALARFRRCPGWGMTG
jgi:glutathione S-transferase